MALFNFYTLRRSLRFSSVFKYIVFDVSCPIVNYNTEDGALVLARCTFGKVIDYSDGSDCHKYISVECNDKGTYCYTCNYTCNCFSIN